MKPRHTFLITSLLIFVTAVFLYIVSKYSNKYLSSEINSNLLLWGVVVSAAITALGSINDIFQLVEKIQSERTRNTKERISNQTEVIDSNDKAKASRKKFDAFFAYNNVDKNSILVIYDELKRRGLNPWLDIYQIPPGRLFQDYLQTAISKSRVGIIIVGPSGFGRWQEMELRTLISLCINSKVPVIPVLLPGVDNIPDDYLFLKEFNWVQFPSLIDISAFDKLEWGIKGKKINT